MVLGPAGCKQLVLFEHCMYGRHCLLPICLLVAHGGFGTRENLVETTPNYEEARSAWAVGVEGTLGCLR